MDEMNNTMMNEVSEIEVTDIVPEETTNLVYDEGSTEEKSSGGLAGMLVVGAVALAGYGIGKLGEKVIKKVIKTVGPKVKNKIRSMKTMKTESDEPVDIEVEAEEVETEEDNK